MFISKNRNNLIPFIKFFILIIPLIIPSIFVDLKFFAEVILIIAIAFMTLLFFHFEDYPNIFQSIRDLKRKDYYGCFTVVLGLCIFLCCEPTAAQLEWPVLGWRSLPIVIMFTFLLFEYFFLQTESFIVWMIKRVEQLLCILILYYLLALPLLLFLSFKIFKIHLDESLIYILWLLGGIPIIFVTLLLIFYFLRDSIKTVTLKYKKTITDRKVVQNSIVMLAIWLLVAWFFAMLYSTLPSITHQESFLKENNTFIETGSLDNLYFSVTTLTSLGYGDINPVVWGKTIACIEVLAGYLLLSLTVGILGGMIIKKL